jgi:hypothetical protein
MLVGPKPSVLTLPLPGSRMERGFTLVGPKPSAINNPVRVRTPPLHPVKTEGMNPGAPWAWKGVGGGAGARYRSRGSRRRREAKPRSAIRSTSAAAIGPSSAGEKARCAACSATIRSDAGAD